MVSGSRVRPYLFNAPFLLAVALYAIDRWIVPGLVSDLHPVLANHFRDLLTVPCALPPVLLLVRLLGLRDNDGPPTAGETTFAVVVYSLWFEGIGPLFAARATQDWIDTLAYALGAVGAHFLWRLHCAPFWPRSQSPPRHAPRETRSAIVNSKPSRNE